MHTTNESRLMNSCNFGTIKVYFSLKLQEGSGGNTFSWHIVHLQVTAVKTFWTRQDCLLLTRTRVECGTPDTAILYTWTTSVLGMNVADQVHARSVKYWPFYSLLDFNTSIKQIKRGNFFGFLPDGNITSLFGFMSISRFRILSLHMSGVWLCSAVYICISMTSYIIKCNLQLTSVE